MGALRIKSDGNANSSSKLIPSFVMVLVDESVLPTPLHAKNWTVADKRSPAMYYGCHAHCTSLLSTVSMMEGSKKEYYASTVHFTIYLRNEINAPNSRSCERDDGFRFLQHANEHGTLAILRSKNAHSK